MNHCIALIKNPFKSNSIEKEITIKNIDFIVFELMFVLNQPLKERNGHESRRLL